MFFFFFFSRLPRQNKLTSSRAPHCSPRAPFIHLSDNSLQLEHGLLLRRGQIGNQLLEEARREHLVERDDVVQQLDNGRVVPAVEDHGGLDGGVCRTVEVVRRAARGRHVQGGFAARVARVEDLEDVELAAAAGPAGALLVLAVLGGERDLGVHDPDGGHVGVEARFARQRHGEFQEEDLVVAAEAVLWFGVSVMYDDADERVCWVGNLKEKLTVGEASWTGVAAFAVVAAYVAEDDDLVVVADHGVPEDLGRFDPVAAIVRSIRKRGAESNEGSQYSSRVRALALLERLPRECVCGAKVVEENKTFGLLLSSVIVSLSPPATARYAGAGGRCSSRRYAG